MNLDARSKLTILASLHGGEHNARRELLISRPTWARWVKQNRIPNPSIIKLIDETIARLANGSPHPSGGNPGPHK